MARISLEPALGHDWLHDKYYGAMTIAQHSVKSATFLEAGEGDDRIVFAGSGLAYASNDMTGGTITTITFSNAEGDVYAVFDNLDIKTSKLPDFDASDSKIDFFEFLIKGDDRIVGSNGRNFLDGGRGDDVMFGNGGDDSFDGGAGNDRMTGGRGYDSFVAFAGQGRDVITDFHGTGPEDQRDLLSVFASFTLKQDGKDVIVDIDEATGSIRLLGCKIAQVEDNIFQL